jgi:hypothetical protein
MLPIIKDGNQLDTAGFTVFSGNEITLNYEYAGQVVTTLSVVFSLYLMLK